ncbi:MAG: hypothetical protein AAF394_16765, partial [Planctomycetota bacterium]
GTLFGGELPPIGWQSTPEDRPAAYTGSLESLSDDQVLQRWVQGIVTRAANPTGFPHVPAPQVPTSTKTLFRIGVAATLLMGLACGGLAWSMYSRTSEMKEQIAKLKEPQAEKKQLDEQIKGLNEALGKLRVEAKDAKAKQDNLRLLTDQSDRFSVLLQSLADQAGTNLVVDSIRPDGKGMILAGRTIRSDAVTQLVQRLETTAAQVGWYIRPPSVTGSNRTVGGGPWTFTIELIDSRPTAPEIDSQPEAITSLAKPTSASALREGRD